MTTLRCSDYRCTKTTVNAFRDDRSWDDRRANESAAATLNNILCNLHAGSLRRSKYRDDPLPLTDADRERLLAEQAVVDEERREEARKNAIAADERDARNHAEAWAFMDLPGSHQLVPDSDRRLQAEEHVFIGQVWAGEENPRASYENRWFQVEPSTRDYGRPGKRPYPYVIRVMRGANLSPNEARALAAALVEAAGKAEELNAKRAPEGKTGVHEHQFHYGRCTVAGCTAVREA